MPFSQETKALAEHIERIGKDLHRDWLAQVGIAFLGLLFVMDSSLAKALAANLKIELELIRILVPVASLYLFARLGDMLGTYLILRARLLESIRDQPDRDLLSLMLQSNSIYFFIAQGLIPDENKQDAPQASIIVSPKQPELMPIWLDEHTPRRGR